MQRLKPIVSRRRGVVLGLWGDPGIGKTWLVAELMRKIPCQGVSLHALTPYTALVQALPHSNELAAWAEQVLGRLAKGEHPEVERVAEALTAWLAALAPMVLCLEDLHEASPERLRLWQALAEGVTRTRGVALVATTRVALPEPFEVYRLEAISPAEMLEVLEQEAASPLPHEATAWIEAHAGGNPLFALEYFRHLTRMGYLWSDGSRWRWRKPDTEPIPTTIEAVILQQLHSFDLSKEARKVLLVRAMLPLELDKALIASVAGIRPSQLREIDQQLAAEGIFHQGQPIQFIHPLVREVVLAQALPLEREQIARRVVEELQQSDPVLAARFLPDAGWPGPQARELLERAVAVAQAQKDWGQAARLMAQAADYAHEPGGLEGLLQAARMLREVNLSEALELAQKAQRQKPQHLEATLLLAELLAEQGRGQEGEQLLAGLKPNRAQEGKVLQSRVLVKHFSHDYAGVLALWQQHLLTQIDPSLVARALVQLRRLDEAEAFIARALGGKLEPFERAQLLYIKAFIPHFAGDYAASEREFSAFLQTLNQQDDGSPQYHDMLSGTYQLRAYARNALGQPIGAIADIREAMRFSVEQGNGGIYAFRQSELGLYLMESGEYPKAEEALLESRAVLERMGNLIYLARLEWITAQLYLEWAPPYGAVMALKHARKALDYARQAGSPPAVVGAWLVTGWAEAVHGQTGKALALMEELELLAIATRQPAFSGAAQWVRGLALERMGRLEEAKSTLQGAVASARPLQVGPHPERMALELDRLTLNVEAARARVQRLRAQNMLSAVQVAQRYLPQLAQLTQATPLAPLASSPAPAKDAVGLEVLGSMALGGQTLSERTRKGKELLARLLEARLSGQNEVSQLELLDTLYPEMDEEQATAALKQLVYRLRSGLEHSVILRKGSGYALGAVRSDAEAFLETGDTRLWRGLYLQGLEHNSLVRDSLYHALKEKASELLSIDPQEALRVGNLLKEADPYDLEALSLVLQAHQRLGSAKAMREVYRQSRERLSEVGENLPPELEDFLKADKST